VIAFRYPPWGQVPEDDGGGCDAGVFGAGITRGEQPLAAATTAPRYSSGLPSGRELLLDPRFSPFPTAEQVAWKKNEKWLFRCMCGIDEVGFDDGTMMLQCEECDSWCHDACAARWKRPNVPRPDPAPVQERRRSPSAAVDGTAAVADRDHSVDRSEDEEYVVSGLKSCEKVVTAVVMSTQKPHSTFNEHTWDKQFVASHRNGCAQTSSAVIDDRMGASSIFPGNTMLPPPIVFKCHKCDPAGYVGVSSA